MSTKIMLRSLLREGGVSPRRIWVIAFGSPFEAKVTGELLRAEFSDVSIDVVNIYRREFAFLKDALSTGDWALVADYLRAWVGRQVVPYIWLDSDILVNRDVQPLLRLSSRVATLAMAPDGELPSRRRDESIGWMLVNLYTRMGRAILGRDFELPRANGLPLKLNCGVIVAGRNCGPQWRQFYREYRALVRDREFRRVLRFYESRYGFVPVGQGIWNLIHSASGGQVLDSDFNCLRPNDHATIDHYVSWLKVAFPIAAILKKLA